MFIKHLFCIATLVFCFTSFRSFAQENPAEKVDTTLDLDMLTVPNSPAFSLLGISPSHVDRPTTPNDFAASVANATGNFSQLPKDYAIEFLPIKLLSKKTAAYSAKFDSNKVMANIWRTFTISSAFTSNDTVDTSVPGYIKTRSAFGFRFSILRGDDIDTAHSKYREDVEKIRTYLSDMHRKFLAKKDSILKDDSLAVQLQRRWLQTRDEIWRLDSIMKKLQPSGIAGTLDSIKKKIEDAKTLQKVLGERRANRIEEIKKLVYDLKLGEAEHLKNSIENTKFQRYGWVLDFAGGTVLGFRNDDFQNSIVQNYALWFNGGYLAKNGFNFLALARYNTNVNALTDTSGKKSDQTSFDLGGKLEYISADKKFAINAEGVARMQKDRNIDTTVFRYTLNISYQVGKNQAITFTMGKAFGGSTAYGGNLIAALNFIRTFGSRKQVLPSARKPKT